jgi:uncharacterized secreted repeat protein (TIGR03808 family)
MLNRRRLILGAASLAAGATFAPAAARAATPGGVDAAGFGLRPNAAGDQSSIFQKMLGAAALTDTPLFLPPGTYVVSNISLPRRVRLSGVAGATRLLFGGDGHFLRAERSELVDLDGIMFDGAHRWLDKEAKGLLDFRHVPDLTVRDCRIVDSGRNGLALEAVSGRIEGSTVSGAADAGIFSVEAGRLTIAGNTVADCANGGILVHRWQPGEDGTMITGNRIARVAARNGGTGQFGNGINAFRANGVLIADNSLEDCAFSAIRANGSSNIRIRGNAAQRSGETALYTEFAFDGAVISANLIDGAANGISVVNFNEGGRMGAVSGNIVRNLSTTGPYPADAPGFGVGISVEADCAVSGNVVEGAPLYGIGIGWGAFLRDVVATGNVIRDAGTGIAVSVAPGAGRAVITDNLVSGARKGGVVGYAWTKPVTGELGDGAGTEAWPNLTVARNQVG